MFDGKGDQSGCVEVDVLAGHNVGIPSYLAGDAAADTGEGDEFASWCADPTETAVRMVVCASVCRAAVCCTAACHAVAATTAATAACRVFACRVDNGGA